MSIACRQNRQESRAVAGKSRDAAVLYIYDTECAIGGLFRLILLVAVAWIVFC